MKTWEDYKEHVKSVDVEAKKTLKNQKILQR